MEPKGFSKLMGSLVTVRAEGADGNGSPVAAEPVQPPEGTAADATSNAIDLSTEEPTAAARTGDEFDEPEEEEHEEPAGNEPGGEVHEIDLTPPALELEPWEAAFMNAMHPLIGSPRSAKRFVNVYQFIRARKQGKELERFRGTKAGGEYQVAGLLLAALVGFSRESRPLFRRLMTQDDPAREWWKLVEEETAVPNPAAEGAEGRLRFAAAMRGVRSACTFDDSVALFREWAPTISRFSFRSAHAEAEE